MCVRISRWILLIHTLVNDINDHLMWKVHKKIVRFCSEILSVNFCKSNIILDRTVIDGALKPWAGIGERYVNGEKVDEVEMTEMHISTFSLSETFDVGKDLGSPVSLDYYDRAPFRFNGKIEKIDIRYIQ